MPTPIRAIFAAVLALLGVTLALVQPGGRALDQWAFAAAAYVLAPRRLTWTRPEPDPAQWRVTTRGGWAELDLDVTWLPAGDSTDDDDEHSASRWWLGRRSV